MDDDTEPRKVAIEYPCRWTYQIIGREEMRLREAVAEAVGPREHALRSARQSRTGRYCSVHLEMMVASEGERLRVFDVLKTHEAVAFVL